MKTKVLNEVAEITCALILATGEAPIKALTRFAETPSYLVRRHHPASGLALIDISGE